MRWEVAGGAVALWCAACGQSNSNQPHGAVAGSGAGGAGQATKGGASADSSGGVATHAGGSGAGGTGLGMCKGTTNHAGGTRLKGRFWVTAEGDRAWDTLFDSELNQPCDFNHASDGSMRCIPNHWDDSVEVFADAGCTQPLYTKMKIAACVDADYIMQVKSGSCEVPGGYAFFALGAPAGPGKIYAKSGSSCAETLPLDQPLYTKGAEVPPSTFLPGTEMEFEAPTRVHTRGVLGADGARVVWSWTDSQLDAGESCAFQKAEDGKTRCLPQSGYLSYFSDATCASPLFFARPRCDQKVPGFAVQYPSYDCTDQPSKVFERGEPYTADPYNGTPDMCEAVTQALEGMLYLAKPAPPERFQEATPTIDESDPGRLKARYYDAGANGCWFHDFWDSELKTPCLFGTASDGTERCLPSAGLGTLSFFTDAACTVPAPYAPVLDCTSTAPPAYSTNAVPDSCDRRSNVWKVGESVLKVDLPPLFSKATGVCVANAPAEEKFLRLTLVDPSQLMAGELEVE